MRHREAPAAAPRRPRPRTLAGIRPPYRSSPRSAASPPPAPPGTCGTLASRSRAPPPPTWPRRPPQRPVTILGALWWAPAPSRASSHPPTDSQVSAWLGRRATLPGRRDLTGHLPNWWRRAGLLSCGSRRSSSWVAPGVNVHSWVAPGCACQRCGCCCRCCCRRRCGGCRCNRGRHRQHRPLATPMGAGRARSGTVGSCRRGGPASHVPLPAARVKARDDAGTATRPAPASPHPPPTRRRATHARLRALQRCKRSAGRDAPGGGAEPDRPREASTG